MSRPGASVQIRLACFLLAAILGPALDSQAQDLKSLMQQAFALHQAGQFADALPLLHRAHALDPNDYFVNLLLGIDSLRAGSPQTAFPYLKRAARLRPHEDVPLGYLAEIYARQQLYAEAVEAHLAAVNVSGGSEETAVAFVDFAAARFASMSARLRSSKRGLAAEYRLRALGLLDDVPARLSNLQRAADLDDTAPGIWADLAWAALAAHDAASAQDFIAKALAADANDLHTWIADARLAAEQSNWKLAFERLSAIAQRSPSQLSDALAEWPRTLLPPSSLAMSGSAAAFFACVREADRECRLTLPHAVPVASPERLFREQRWELLSKSPIAANAPATSWLRRGIALAHLRNCTGAIPALERAIQKSESDVYGMYQLSWCYSREAGLVADRVQHTQDDEESLHVMRGDILLRLQGKADLALAEYRLATTTNSKDPALLERLAEAEFGAGQIESAQEHAQAALRIDSHRLGAESTLAKIAMQERDYGTALPYLRDLVKSDPADMTTRVDLGRAYAQTGALNEALENLQSAISHGYPDERGSLHSLLGTVLKKMGRDADAERAFTEAARLSDAFQQKSYRDQDSNAQP
jgi:tetratricopeptide (TPR) repeat protein